ncbi:hypothetical protein RxyAA322_23860 [Rubrobacter xylanophilus]|uniref:PucR C-terminal helix-turn-helix domain-containing protein n=1 Tax=Rubrobacter xylanophilus TaxID=49319 RepID=A0A510HKP4_9ACTN|nr:helix-turn-helix domain-containing protein [Rubrobacter xylanophilus]BBL80532.1 hypothetical protein RxyAA322_23860 [Rubrobacter xylanophilus]
MNPKNLLRRLASSPDLAPFRELVRPLAEHDRRRGSDLIRTLRVYFACGANASEAADRLWLHRNSLLYRLQRISSITGLDLKDPEARFALQIGLLAMEQQERKATVLKVKGRGRE